jgi:hypothetical protein
VPGRRPIGSGVGGQAHNIKAEEAHRMEQIKIVVERRPDGFVAYPLGVRGVVVGQGDTAEEALADVTSAIRLHQDTFGPDIRDRDATTAGQQ